MKRKMMSWLIWILASSFVVPGLVQGFTLGHKSSVVPAQVPFQRPPKTEAVPHTSIPPNTEPLSAEQIKRAEALLPLLAGNQELWAMGEFVHLGAPVIPVLVKALKMPNPRLRYNAIETMRMIRAPSAAPALIESAVEPGEILRVREHALRVAVRLNPAVTVEAITAIAKDSHDTIRKTAAFESRYVRDKAVVPVLIELIKDEQRYVAITAVQSLWLLTRHETPLHDWEISTQQDRADWAQEWVDWWAANRETFELPIQTDQRQPT
jgi:HEAT repeat protein